MPSSVKPRGPRPDLAVVNGATAPPAALSTEERLARYEALYGPLPAPPILSADVVRMVESAKGIFLDIGCSDHKQAGSVGMDIRGVAGVDIVHDITVTPWPLPDACCHRILASHILEHIPPDKIMGLMAEAHRVLRPLGQMMIAMPYGVSPRALQDPTHFRCWIESVPQYWDCAYPLYTVYRPPCFKVELCEYQSIGDIAVILGKRDTEHGPYHEAPHP